MTNLTDLTVSGAITATGGVVGALTGSVSGTIVGNVTGSVTGQQILPAITPTDETVIPPATVWVGLMHAADAGTYTLAAPGATNVGKIMTLTATSARAHVVTVTGLVGGTTLTFTAAIGHTCQILAVSSTVWAPLSLTGVVQS
jgi:hypothetical protein